MDVRGRELFRGAAGIFRKFWPDPATDFQTNTTHEVRCTPSPVCSRDIIIQQASVRQAKFVFAALARPRDSLPAAPICTFFCFGFFAAPRQR
jgi:hypothetical protein